MSFQLSKAVDPNKVFLTRKSDVNNRLDPFYYIPSVVVLEKKIRNATPHRLRDFVVKMAGGATPLTSEAETHYTEGSDGVPFIRVQNLSTTGKLSLEDCKRITRSTHETLLGRSKLSGGELLVKITGVGRMAVASVAPERFEGNINQHIVAIRTKDMRTSETLAAYLNLDIAERLASRRSTGGTRPALDYPALLSIPVIFDERIPKLVGDAVKDYEEKLAKSKQLLGEIDKRIFTELGIKLPPEPSNTLGTRIFLRPLSQVSGNRFDPSSHWKRLVFAEGKYPTIKLSDLFAVNPHTGIPKIEESADVSFVPMDAVSDVYGEIADQYTRPISESKSYTAFQEGDLIWAKITPCMENGKSAVAENLVEGFAFGSTEFHVFRPKRDDVSIHYLHALLRLKVVRKHARLFFTGSSGHLRVDEQFFRRLVIPFPPLKDQERICMAIADLRNEARRLLKEAEIGLKKAKQEIEEMILSKGSQE